MRGEMDLHRARVERVAHNENAGRQANDAVGRGLGEHLDDQSGLFGFLCECGRGDCRQRLRVTLEAYESVRRDSMRFLVVPGHVDPEGERVVERTAGFWVVEKFEEVRAIVEAGDPRRA